ncbi:MAG: hypothetical protein VB049_06435 [Candidatus Pelethousia sp.]|nr:hypothetical protein [Candidatus Pelethousia sp.]
MKPINKGGSFLLCLLLNLLLHFTWSIPAWILLGLHFWLGLSIWWFSAALALWVFMTFLLMGAIGLAAGCESPAEKRRTNKMPACTNRQAAQSEEKSKG